MLSYPLDVLTFFVVVCALLALPLAAVQVTVGRLTS